MRLRPVDPGDVEAYIRMRCDGAMMADLGGPLPPDRMPGQVARDVDDMTRDEAWIYMIVVDDAGKEVVAGTVTVAPHTEPDSPERHGEIGWMVLPEHRGSGLATAAAREVLHRVEDSGRWRMVHAFPSVSNDASNAICRAVGFDCVGQRVITFAGHAFTTNHWQTRTADG